MPMTSTNEGIAQGLRSSRVGNLSPPRSGLPQASRLAGAGFLARVNAGWGVRDHDGAY